MVNRLTMQLRNNNNNSSEKVLSSWVKIYPKDRFRLKALYYKKALKKVLFHMSKFDVCKIIVQL